MLYDNIYVMFKLLDVLIFYIVRFSVLLVRAVQNTTQFHIMLCKERTKSLKTLTINGSKPWKRIGNSHTLQTGAQSFSYVQIPTFWLGFMHCPANKQINDILSGG